MNQSRQRDILFWRVAGAEACWIYTALLLLDVKAANGDLPILGSCPFNPLPLSWEKRSAVFPGNYPSFSPQLDAVVRLVCCSCKTYAAPFGNPLEPAWIHSFVSGIFQVSSISPEQLILVCSILLWWLGGRLLHLPLDFSTLLTEFQFGVAILLILFFF